MSSVQSLFDEFEKRAVQSDNSDKTQLLDGKDNHKNFNTLKQQILLSQKSTAEGIAAIIIQRKWRSYRAHVRFTRFLHTMRKNRKLTLRPYFNLLLLNSHVVGKGRENYFNEISPKYLTMRPFNFTTKKASFLFYSQTDILFIPLKFDEAKYLTIFKQINCHLLSKLISEWRIIIHHEKAITEEKQYDKKSLLQFGSYFSIFQTWYKYVLYKRHKQETNTSFPQWANIKQKLVQKDMLLAKSRRKFKETLQTRVITSLTRNMYNHRMYRDKLKEADETRLKSILKLGHVAWCRYMITKKENDTIKRNIMFSWLRVVLNKTHTALLFKVFKERTEMLKKRMILSAFIKNQKIQKVLKFNSSIKLTNEVALALWACFSMMPDKEENAALCGTFYAWKKITKGRRMWTHFMLADVKATEYNPLKRKFLDALIHKKVQKVTTDIRTFNSRPFMVESMTMYENVMTKNDDRKDFSLLVDDPKIIEEIAQTRNAIQQRKVFSKAWRSLKYDPTMFKRIVMLVMVKEKQKNDVLPPEQCTKRTYMTAINTLSMFGFLSNLKFNTIQRILVENEKRMLNNRTRSLNRDQVLILSQESYEIAQQMNELDPSYTVENPYKRPSTAEQISRVNNLVKDSIQELIPITSIEPGDNETEFVLCKGCKTRVPPFKKQLRKIHQQIQNDLKKVAIDVDSKRLKRISLETAAQSRKLRGRTNISTDNFYKSNNNNNNNIKPQPRTSIAPKYAAAFPQFHKPPKADVKIVKFFGDDQNSGAEEEKKEEYEEEEDNITLESMQEAKSAKHMLDEARFQQSMTFGNSVVSFLKQSSKFNFSQADMSSTETLEPIDEDDTITDSARLEAFLGRPEEEDESDKKKTKVREYPTEHIENALNIPSISDLSDPEDYTKSKKYKDFLSVLFGKNLPLPATKINNIRRKLEYEMHSRRGLRHTNGIMTSQEVMPISNIAIQFREDKNSLKERMEQRKMLEAERLNKRKRDEYIEQTKNQKDLSFEVKYNARKYRKKRRVKVFKLLPADKIDPNNPKAPKGYYEYEDEYDDDKSDAKSTGKSQRSSDGQPQKIVRRVKKTRKTESGEYEEYYDTEEVTIENGNSGEQRRHARKRRTASKDGENSSDANGHHSHHSHTNGHHSHHSHHSHTNGHHHSRHRHSGSNNNNNNSNASNDDGSEAKSGEKGDKSHDQGNDYDYDGYDYNYEYEYYYDSENDDDDSLFREDLMHEKMSREDLLNGELNLEDSNETVYDGEFDAADPLHGQSIEKMAENEETEEMKSELLKKVPSYYREKILSNNALISVNKVVFQFLEETVNEKTRENDDGMNLVEVDGAKDVPEISIPPEDSDGKRKTLRNGGQSDEGQRKHRPTMIPQPKQNVKIVIPEKRETTDQTLISVFEESEKFNWVTYTNGQSRFRKAKTPVATTHDKKAQTAPTAQYKFSDPELMKGAHFEDEQQVVSFSGGNGRPLTGMKGNFNSVRIKNGKRTSLTKPAAGPIKRPQTQQPQFLLTQQSLQLRAPMSTAQNRPKTQQMVRRSQPLPQTIKTNQSQSKQVLKMQSVQQIQQQNLQNLQNQQNQQNQKQNMLQNDQNMYKPKSQEILQQTPQPKRIPVNQKLQRINSSTPNLTNGVVKKTVDTRAVLERKLQNYIQQFSHSATEKDYKSFSRAVKQMNRNLRAPDFNELLIKKISNALDEISFIDPRHERIKIDAAKLIKTDYATLLSDPISKITSQLLANSITPMESSRAVIHLFRIVPHYTYMLQRYTLFEDRDRLEEKRMLSYREAEKSRDPYSRMFQDSVRPLSSQSKISQRAHFNNIRWVRNLQYNCVALHFGNEKRLDAIIASKKGLEKSEAAENTRKKAKTAAVKVRESDKSETSSVSSFSTASSQEPWNDALSNYDLDELVSITRYIVPENEIDELLKIVQSKN